MNETWGSGLIYINARFLTQQITGVQRFASEISKKLKDFYGDKIRFVCPNNIINQELASYLEVEIIGKQTGHYWEQVELPIYLKSNGNPLLINLCNTAPLLYWKNVLTIHDIAFKVNPSWFDWKFSTWYNFMILTLVKSSKKVVTVSEFSKEELKKYYKIDSGKVIVVPNAISFDQRVSKQGLAEKGNYILAVSSLDPRKNFVRLIRAFKKVQNEYVQLKIVGSSSKVFADDNLKELIESDNRVELTGYVDDDELIRLYHHAKLFVYPSLYEGFGIPPLEAMSLGCPTLVSDIGSLRETCRDGALFFNPFDDNDLYQKMTRLLNDEILSSRLVEKGSEVAKSYSWDKSAKIMINLIDQLQ